MPMASKFGKLTKTRSFILMVVIPTLLAAVYFGAIASDVYISESKFVVKSAEKQAISPFGTMLQSAGLSSSNGDIHSVYHYIMSRDALRSLNKDDAYKKSVTRPEIDILSRFNGLGMGDNFEELFEYYMGRVEAIIDADSSIMTLRVRAYNPADSMAINKKLIRMSEELVNNMSDRSRRDMISFAEGEADRAIQKARDTSKAVSEFRDTNSIFDPTAQSALQLQLVSKLQDEIVATKGRLSQTQYLAPNSPQINFLKKEIEHLQKQINVETAKVAGGEASLSKTTTEFEEKELDRQVARQRLAAAISALEQAHNEALRQTLYLQLVARPSLPDDAAEPNRIENVGVVFAIAIFMWGISCMMVAGVREHYD